MMKVKDNSELDALIESGQFDAASNALRQAKQNDQSTAIRRNYIWGRLMYRTRRYADARKAFTAVLSAEPNNGEFYKALSAASYHCGDVLHAEKVTRAYFKRFPTAKRSAGEPELRVLVLDAAGFDYFSNIRRHNAHHIGGNFVGAILPGRVAYTHVAADCIDSLETIL